ncbi:integrase core domain-containing protein [Streptomyces triticiradicis]|uniref:integrase core domain-containing protein n=1 Tax=Streptomyces triticiradicis TaxID=2651189 RepID=UPI001CEDBB96|nr:integrase core domain-containing protein [Streptomyces triticiradicis]
MNAAAGSRSTTSRGRRNPPPTPERRLRLCLRVGAGRPIAHVAAGSEISRRCLIDNGACHRSTTWADAPAATGTKHERTRPYTPRPNGKVDEVQRDAHPRVGYVRDCATEHERRVAPAEFVNHYTYERPHAALGGRPPVSRTAGSDYRIVFDQPPEPLADIPQQFTFEGFA